uniref:Uncharacterized protein n=1 Tax=Octactis speculum TaxID=3111310 RepID=A0A7S2H9G0_9STRA|mmetsp:Transcript_62649/g.86114  ORF Transcript_62649/g.86114 Transcript_62649/m.86114 type:complete len:138 (+) Transcript_62649:62-475(+)
MRHDNGWILIGMVELAAVLTEGLAAQSLSPISRHTILLHPKTGEERFQCLTTAKDAILETATLTEGWQALNSNHGDDITDGGVCEIPRYGWRITLGLCPAPDDGIELTFINTSEEECGWLCARLMEEGAQCLASYPL